MRMLSGKPYAGQQGFSLLELMIAMVIGLILIAGTFTIFVSNSESFRLQRGLSDVQESGRFALDFLVQDARQAESVTATMSNSAAAANTLGTAGNNALLVVSDAVTIRYTAPPGSTDCQGNARTDITNRYYIALDADGQRALFCDGAGGSAGDALVQGVEGFQIQYGIAGAADATNGTGRAVRYVDNPAATARIVTVRFALLVRSNEGVQGLPAVSAAIPLLRSSASTAALDGVRINGQRVVHRLFVSTAALRNVQ